MPINRLTSQHDGLFKTAGRSEKTFLDFGSSFRIRKTRVSTREVSILTVRSDEETKVEYKDAYFLPATWMDAVRHAIYCRANCIF